MSVSVNLYNNYSDPFVVYKNKTLITTVNCEITESSSVDSPELLLDMRSGVKNFNYCYIPEYGRYYFCVVTIENGNQMRLQCSSDPLSSFWDSIRTSPCIAERSTSNPNPELVDDMLPFKPQPKYIRRKMATGFTPSSSGGTYILTVGGK